MSTRKIPCRGKLVVSAIYRDARFLEAAIPRMAEILREVRPAGPEFPFDWTEYYAEEMGSPLFRRFLVGEVPVPRDALPDIKIGLEQIERDLAVDGRRTVNLDPGLLTPENFLLATGKNFSHRVYLRDGVFADLELVFRGGEFRPMPWTYPDYASEEIRSLLRDLRRDHLASRPLC